MPIPFWKCFVKSTQQLLTLYLCTRAEQEPLGTATVSCKRGPNTLCSFPQVSASSRK